MLMHPDFMHMGRDISVLWVTLPPGASTGFHQHADQAEYEYIVSGTGVLNAGDEVIPVAPFMLVLNPPGLVHNIENTGGETMYLLRFHVPSLSGDSVHGDLIGKCIEAAKKSIVINGPSGNG